MCSSWARQGWAEGLVLLFDIGLMCDEREIRVILSLDGWLKCIRLQSARRNLCKVSVYCSHELSSIGKVPMYIKYMHTERVELYS